MINHATIAPSVAAMMLTAISVGATTAAAAPQTSPQPSAAHPDGQGLLLATAVFDDGRTEPLPARVEVLLPDGAGGWHHGWFEDADSNVFHKAMAYQPAAGPSGILTLGGTAATVKLWSHDGDQRTLWEADFGGTFSRMRDAEVGDVYGDGGASIAIATHDQGVVAVLRPDGDGGFDVIELDRRPETIVHEIELGDLDGDGTLEIYATPSAPNRVDGSPQPGEVVRYVPAADGGREVVANLDDRHAKEILVTDLDGDGRDELYVVVEAISGGDVEIRRVVHGLDPNEADVVAELPDKLCRFLTAGDVDGDGAREIVAATHRHGLWLLRPGPEEWELELIDRDSSSFEHASILLDLDGDGRDELYVASDNQNEVRRYDRTEDGWDHTVILEYTDGLDRFTWNIMPAPSMLIPDVETTLVVLEEDEPEPPRGMVVDAEGAAPGHVLFAPLLSDTTFLIDDDGQVVHTWHYELAPGGSVYLLDNGHLLRTAREWDVPVFSGGGQSGRIVELDWEGNTVWEYVLATEQRLMHHDIEQLPNGNVLAIAWEARDAAECARVGRRAHMIPEKGLWPDVIIELEPTRPEGARIVWEWRMWDHLVQDELPDGPNYGEPARFPHRIDINGDGEPEPVDDAELERLKKLGYMPADTDREQLRSDLLHINAVHYNEGLDQIALSVPRFNEIWVIDHSTTTEEAAGSSGGRWGRGGDLLYRWGNPESYGRGDELNQQLHFQHDARWIPDDYPGGGSLMIFNNNAGTAEDRHSEVLAILPRTDDDGNYVIDDRAPFGPVQPLWSYADPETFHASFISGAHRLSNGNTFVTSGPQGRFFEVTPTGEIVWEYRSIYSGNVTDPNGAPPHPVGSQTHAVFRATKLDPDHPGLAGRDLRPLDPQPPVILPTD